MTATEVLLFDPDDRRLFERLRAGDEAAFQQAFRAHYTELCSFARRYVQSIDVAEELVDDVFTKVWTDRDHLPISGSLRGYLFGATRNRAISALRREVVERDFIASERWRDLLPTHVENEGSRSFDYSDVRRAVRETLDELPTRCRTALVLRWHRQLSRAEIAEAMGISVKTLEIYLTRGAKALRAKYRELYGE